MPRKPPPLFRVALHPCIRSIISCSPEYRFIEIEYGSKIIARVIRHKTVTVLVFDKIPSTEPESIYHEIVNRCRISIDRKNKWFQFILEHSRLVNEVIKEINKHTEQINKHFQETNQPYIIEGKGK